MILKKKLLMLFSSVALITTTVYSDIVINDKLTITGFIDMSYVSKDEENVGSTDAMNFDQFELDFLFKFDENFSGQVDLDL